MAHLAEFEPADYLPHLAAGSQGEAHLEVCLPGGHVLVQLSAQLSPQFAEARKLEAIVEMSKQGFKGTV